MCLTARLSQKIAVGFTWVVSRSLRSHLIQRTSLTVVAMALYSASADDRDTTDCFLDFQETGAPPRIRRYPVLDLLVMGQPSQSESVYATKSFIPFFGKRMP
ncbi:hypothetical protein Hanom_Chr14g01314711 [Helianthus anomalus]